MSVARLRAIQEIKKNPEMIKLMADFKRYDIYGLTLADNQIENEEELAHYFLKEEDKLIK